MRAYCDSSVLGDLLLNPRESRRTRDYLTSWQQQGTVATSQLTVVELEVARRVRGGDEYAPKLERLELGAMYNSGRGPVMRRPQVGPAGNQQGAMPCAYHRSAGEEANEISCERQNEANRPSCAKRSTRVPCSTARPSSRKTMRSALRIVERRCAITKEVRPRISSSRAS